MYFLCTTGEFFITWPPCKKTRNVKGVKRKEMNLEEVFLFTDLVDKPILEKNDPIGCVTELRVIRTYF